MWKIVKSNLEKVQIKKETFLLWMKWQFKIEFANDNFWPYDYKFAREDCYYIDGLQDRWTVEFPLKNKKFNNTEIFLENDDIIICIWERGGLLWDTKQFIDVINLKTEKKQRIFTSEVNLIYNQKDHIVVNAKIGDIWKTLFLDLNTLEIAKQEDEELYAFFKCIYNHTKNTWHLLDFKWIWNWWNDGYFSLKPLYDIPSLWKQNYFDRKNFFIRISTPDGVGIDLWELSCK